MAEPADQKIWAEGFRHAYAGFQIQHTGADRVFAAGYTAGRQLRDVQLQEVQRALAAGPADAGRST